MHNCYYSMLATAENEAPATDVVTMEQTNTDEVILQDSGTAPEAVDGVKSTGKKGKMDPGSIILLVVMFVLMYFILFRGPRKQQKEQSKMRQSLEKNDRVQTIGGILGTIIDINDEEITLKIDESNNTKMKIARAAVSKKIS